MSNDVYRVIFIFEIGEIYRLQYNVAEEYIRESNLLHRVTPNDIVVAWLQEYLEKEMAVVIQPTEHTWAKSFFFPDLHHPGVEGYCYRTFHEALHPITHPCFHAAARLTVSQFELKLEYVVQYKDLR